MTPPFLRRCWALGLLAAGAATAGCGAGFDPYNRLNSLRVLAVRSEPVEPMADEATTLSAKIFAPVGQTVAYDWSWCPFATAPGAPCPFTEEQASAAAGVPISYHLGTDPEVSFPIPIPPAVFTALCAGMPGLPAPDCTGGFPVQLQLTVTSSMGDTQTDQVQAARPLRVRFEPTSDETNTNPKLEGLYALMGDPAAMIAIDDAATPVLPRNVNTVVGAKIADGDSQTYTGKNDDNQVAQVQERLYLSWFVETGDTNHQRTTYIAGSASSTIEAASTIKWSPGFKKDYAPDKSKLIVIIRDDREGVDWAEGSVSLEDHP